MKRICFLSLIMCLSMLLFVPNANADVCTGCTPGYWTTGPQIISKYVNCDILIDYEYKKCSDITGSIRITNIEISPYGCGLQDEDLIMNRAVRQIIEDASSILGIPAPGQGWTLDVITDECWELTSSNNHMYLEPCGTSNCCATQYLVHSSGDYGNLTIIDEILNTSSQTAACPSVAGQNCHFMCDNHIIPKHYPVIWNGPPDDVCIGACSTPYTVDREVIGSNFSGLDIQLHALVSTRTCNGVLEARIDGMYLTGTQWSSTTPNTLNAFSYAVERILYEYFSEGVTEIYIRMPACWDRTAGIFTYCSEECCSYYYELGLNGFGDPSILYMDAGNESVTCETTCINACSALAAVSTVLPASKIKVDPDMGQNELLNQGSSSESTVIPNPSTGETEIRYSSNYNGRAVIKIYNSIGNLVEEKAVNKNGISTAWKINTTNYTNGSYFYSIIIDNMIVNNGAFLVSH